MLSLLISLATWINAPLDTTTMWAIPTPVEVRERVRNKKRSRTNRKR